MTIRTANISTLKAQLTKYLQFVRNGKEIAVLDRKTPIARIIPWLEDSEDLELQIQKPKKSFQAFLKLRLFEISTPINSLQLLMEDRSKR